MNRNEEEAWVVAERQEKIVAQEQLERRILHGLSCEWESAVWILEDHYRKFLKKPLFCLSEMRKKLGYWSSDKRVICLSRDFVLNHSWDSVRDVLLHETAHQVTEELLGVQNEPVHGETFHRACYLLRANPKASGEYPPLDEQTANPANHPNDKIMMRVRKLLALAQSQNRNEAEAAMAKAHTLILKYNLDMLRQEKARNYISVFVSEPALRHFREAYHLARLLIDYYFVEGLWVSSYVMDRGKMGRVFEISGTMQNVKIACYVHDFICRYIDSQWSDYNSAKERNRYRKTDFAVGVIKGFRSKLNSGNSSSESSGKNNDNFSLMKIEDPGLKDYIAYRYPHITRFSRRISRVDMEVLKDGERAGENLVISRAITERGKNKGILIGHSVGEKG